MKRALIFLGVTVVVVYASLHLIGRGFLVADQHAGVARARAVSGSVVKGRAEAVGTAATTLGVAEPKQILFGDLHVHTTFSFDAFQMSLPLAGGDGAHPVADACDYARHCSGLDFWSINDHGITLTPRRWKETVDAIRHCNEVAGSEDAPDLVSYLGWEWTQVGTIPENHWGHKNVIVRDLADDAIPARPITAGTPEGLPSPQDAVPAAAIGLLAVAAPFSGGPEFARFMAEIGDLADCPTGVPVRELPLDCREVARTPEQLFAKLDDWGHETMVIPHGTTWGFYTPGGSSWDKQLTPAQHDPARQQVVEVFSGHGNSEEYRSFREAVQGSDGRWQCPEPSDDFVPSCWRAGEIIAERCLTEGLGEDECAKRAAFARDNHIRTAFNGGFATIPGTTLEDWQNAGQCRDCFQPAFNYRPKSSVQYMMALGRPDQASSGTDRFRFGFIASSDNHSARPGTGYKEVSRAEFTEARFGNFVDTYLGRRDDREPVAEASVVDVAGLVQPFANFETERQASFFLNGGLAAVHADGRDRDAIWDALERREVYGTSGPRILLWFDLVNGPDGRERPMGSEVALAEEPSFRVRAAGSFMQNPGCPADATSALAPDQVARLCQGECYHPTDTRRPIDRIEVVRIRPQLTPDEDVDELIEDPWRTFDCPDDPSGCSVTFSDPEYVGSRRDVLYYVRAIETTTDAVGADPLGCTAGADGRCVDIDPCIRKPWTDDCLAPTQERAWSSPIFVGQP